MKQSERPKGTILIVSDNPRHLLALTQMLTAQGYEIRSADNGHIALNVLPTILPDLILLESLMPGIDGYELCRRLKAADATRAIPVIFLRGLDETLEKIKAFDAGGIDYITKPFQTEEVLVRIETHLALRKTQEELRKQHDHLEERVEERTAELTIANEQLHQEIAGRKKVEQALRESEKQYRLLFENLQDLFFRVDTDGVILLVSPSIILLLGYLPETVIGTQIT
ncbi:MAG: response regulator, partial [bacterium]|nr:response regulator [bacterium]